MKMAILISILFASIGLLANDTNSSDTFEYKNDTLRIRISGNSVNRIVLPRTITGKILSAEKGLDVKINGNEAYIKANPTKKTEFVGLKAAETKIAYTDREAEVFFITEKKTYAVVFVPAKIDTRTVYIVDNMLDKEDATKIEKNSTEYSKNIKNIFKLAIENDLGKSFSEIVKNEKHDDFYFVSQFDGNQFVVFKFYLSKNYTAEVLEKINKSVKNDIAATAIFDRNYFVLGVKND